MTRIYEALEQAERERVPAVLRAEPVTPADVAERRDSAKLESAEGNFVRLYHHIQRLVTSAAPTVSFVGPSASAGASPLLLKMGRVLVERLGKQVLYVNARTTGWESNWSLENGHCSLTEVIRDDIPLDDVLTRVGPGGLHAVRLASHDVCGNGALVSKAQYLALLRAMSSRFSIILVDIAPPEERPEGLTLLDMLDGVVLVLESESTRVRAAQALLRNVEAHGGRVLGAVLNKRRHRIPQFIYDRL